MATRAVLLDLDDTLLDHVHASAMTLGHVYRMFAEFHTRTVDAVIAHHDELLEELHVEVARGRMPLQAAREERYTRMLAAAGVDVHGARRLAVEVAAEARRMYLRSRKLVPGAMELVRALSGRVVVGIVTNNTVDEQKEKIVSFGLAQWIDFMLVSEEIGITKPDRRIFDEALRRGGVSAGQAVMVGDSWTSDIRGAAGAGIRAVWLNRAGKAMPEKLAGVTEIASLEPLGEVLGILGVTA